MSELPVDAIRLGSDGRHYVREKQPDGTYMDFGPYDSAEHASRVNRQRRRDRALALDQLADPDPFTGAIAMRTRSISLVTYPGTALGSLAASLVLASVFLGGIEVVRLGTVVVDHVEAHRVDEIFLALLLLAGGIAYDYQRAARRRRLELEIADERLRVLQATMRTVQDIVNNFLQNMQLVRLEAEDALSPETVTLLDTLTHDTSAKLKALGDLQHTAEVTMASGTGIDYSSPRHDRGGPA